MKHHKAVTKLSSNPTINEFLAHHINKSELTQREISKACGFKRPNMVSMIKSGDTRVPLERLGPMADALKLDPYELFTLWMKTYYPETWDVLWHHMKRRRPSLPRFPGFSPTGRDTR